MMGAATEKARLPRFSLVLGIKSCSDVDDPSCLGMLEKCILSCCMLYCALFLWKESLNK